MAVVVMVVVSRAVAVWAVVMEAVARVALEVVEAAASWVVEARVAAKMAAGDSVEVGMVAQAEVARLPPTIHQPLAGATRTHQNEAGR